MINFNQVTLMRGERTLFEDVSFTLHNKRKVGLVGANGTGKSSLFGLLLGALDTSEGHVTGHDSLRIAHMAQEVPALDDRAIDYVLQGDEVYYQLRSALDTAEATDDFARAAELHVQFSEIDGYSVPARAAQLLSGLGFNSDAQQQPVKSFSGGWQMRLNLARTLMCRSDLLLLDEPTNHLDLDAILWLERWLQQYENLLIVISHDREFLDKVVNQVAHIEQKRIKLFTGNYSEFEKQHAQQLALQQATYKKQQASIKHLQSFVDRFRYKASKAKQAQSRIRAIERIEQVAAVQVASPFQFEFRQPERSPSPLLVAENVSLGYDEKLILEKIEWRFSPGDRIALLGPNGAGKSTLIKALTGGLLPVKGKIRIAKGITVGYFAQHQLETLTLSQTALEHMRELAPATADAKLRTFLGGFGFAGEAALKVVEKFSGGEKARLVLAMIVWQRPNILLLDEPTNHLDMEMRMALTMALQSFEGALLLVSHDRYLIRNVVDNLYLVANGRLKTFDGDLDDYKTWLLNHYRQQVAPKTEKIVVKAKVSLKAKPKSYNPVKVAALEKEIHELESALKTVTEALADPTIYDAAHSDQSEKLYTELQRLQTALAKAEEAWLTYHGE